MKNKILLFLVLLIPSLCFGESILVQYDIQTEQELATFVVMGTSIPKRIIKFKTHKELIFLSDNKEGMKKLVQLKEIFPKLIDCLADSGFFKSSDTLNPYAGFPLIEQLAIKHNFAVSHKEEHHSEVTSHFLWKYFLYKPDK